MEGESVADGQVNGKDRDGVGQAPDAQRQCVACRVRVLHSGSTVLCRCQADNRPLERGELVVVPTQHGSEIGRVQGEVRSREKSGNSQIVAVKRRATEEDLRHYEEDRAREQHAFEECRRLIEDHGLNMKLVSVHYLLDEPKILVFFTAEERVDFRALVRDLVARFKMRVELRQIGVRDEARMIGGVGVCGREFCCSSVSDRLKPVSIKMAKEQDMSLNSMKISGPCGRLLCCLAYEFDLYREAHRTLPRVGTEIRHDGENFRIQEVNIVSERVRLVSRSGRVMDAELSRLRYRKQDRRWKLDPSAEEEGDGIDMPE